MAYVRLLPGLSFPLLFAAICFANFTEFASSSDAGEKPGALQDPSLNTDAKQRWRSPFFHGTLGPGSAQTRRKSLSLPSQKEPQQVQPARRRHSLPGPDELAKEVGGSDDFKEYKKPRGRIIRAAHAVRRWASGARHRLGGLWGAIKRRASKIKRGVRRAAAKVYARFPRAPWRKSLQAKREVPATDTDTTADTEGPSSSKSDADATAGTEGPLSPQRDVYQHVTADTEGSSSSKSDADETVGTEGSSNLTSAAGAIAGTGGPSTSENLENIPNPGTEVGKAGMEPSMPLSEFAGSRPSSVSSTESTASTKVDTGGSSAEPEGSNDEEEVWYDAPETFMDHEPELSRSLTTPSPRKIERSESTSDFEGFNEEPGSVGHHFDPRSNSYWNEKLSPVLKGVASMAPDLGALWSRFDGTGNMSRLHANMPSLAAMAASKVNYARSIDNTEEGLEENKARLIEALAQKEDNVLREVAVTSKICWFFHRKDIFQKATPQEEATLREMGSLKALFQRPTVTMEKLKRLVDLAYKDIPTCISACEREIKAREELQATIESQKQKLVETLERAPMNEGDKNRQRKVVEELNLLIMKEACSIEQLFLYLTQAQGGHQFIKEYNESGQSWRLYQWPFKAKKCLRKARGDPVVPANIAKKCRSFEKADKPETAEDTSSELRWFWEAGSFR